jgi:serine/threonine protein kinase
MVSNTVGDFLQQLRDSQLLSPAQLNEAQRHPLAKGTDGLPLAKELIVKGWLTAYQAKQLLQGRGQDLVLGSYRLLDCIGEGGMGQVFRASHTAMGRVVALKLIRKDKLANNMAVQRFYQEIRAAAQMVHPNIVAAFDAGQIGDTLFFAMEYVEGVDLSRLVKEAGPLPVAEACEYIRQAAQGLQHAHEKGLIHRDIKPANLLLSKSVGEQVGTVKILDMGLARLQGPTDEPDKGLTRVGAMVGTPGYLAPEQAMNARGVDCRADLYSLGCTFFFLLTGQPPFRGESLNETLLKHHTDAPPPLYKFRSDVPGNVEAIVKKLLAKKPEDRYQTPAELVAAMPALALRKKGGATVQIRGQVPLPAPTDVTPSPKGSLPPLPVAIPVAAPRQNQGRMLLLAIVLLLAVGLTSALALGLFFALSGDSNVAQGTGRGTSSAAAFPFTPRAETRPAAPTRPQETRPVAVVPTPQERNDPTGTWRWAFGGFGGGKNRDVTIRLKLEGDRLTGTMPMGEGRDAPLDDARYRDGEVSFKVSRERDGVKFVVRYEGKVQGDHIRGKTEFDFGGQSRSRDWEAHRVRD